MPIDVSILRPQPLPQGPSLLESQARANQLMASQSQLAMNTLQMQKAQREMQREEQMNALLSNPDVVDPTTGQIKPGAFAVLGEQGAGGLAPKFFELSLSQQKARRESEEAGLKQKTARFELLGKKVQQYRDNMARVTTPEAARAGVVALYADEDVAEFIKSQGGSEEASLKELDAANAAGPEGFQAWQAKTSQAADVVAGRLQDEAQFGYVTREARDILAQMKGREGARLTGAATSLEIGPDGKPMVGAPGVMATTANQILQHQISAELAMEKGNAKLAETFMGLAQKLTQSVPQEYREYLLAKADEGFRQYQLRSREASATKIPISVGSEQAAKGFIDELKNEYATVKTAPDTIVNIEEAKRLIPGAKRFLGSGAVPYLEATKFLNSWLGANFDVEGVTKVEELRSRLFKGILDNLKKLDANPTIQQQIALEKALGNIGTDANALANVLDAYADSVYNRVETYNRKVDQMQRRGISLPYDVSVELPARKFEVKAPDGQTYTFPSKKAAEDFKQQFPRKK
jgi:hypothetical protein